MQECKLNTHFLPKWMVFGWNEPQDHFKPGQKRGERSLTWIQGSSWRIRWLSGCCSWRGLRDAVTWTDVSCPPRRSLDCRRCPDTSSADYWSSASCLQTLQRHQRDRARRYLTYDTHIPQDSSSDKTFLASLDPYFTILL